MAGRNDLSKKALLKNWTAIVKNLANPDEVVDYLFSCKIFTDEMRAEVLQEPERKQKNRKILDTLNYRGKDAAKDLHDAFLDTSNKDLAKLLVGYIKQIQSEDNKISPQVWPPRLEEQEKMESDPVTRITDLKSVYYYHEYTSTDGSVYKMRNKIRGKVFIINNETFKYNPETKLKLSDRPGSDVDVKNLEELFKQLQFEVVIAKDQTSQDMIDFLKKERANVNWGDMECVVLIITSHGKINYIYGTDGKLTKLKDMTDLFDSSQCPGLCEKPRLVFVQACRDRGQDTLDAVPIKETKATEETVHSAADFLIAYATPEGSKAYRNTQVGSWFLNAIVWTFKYHAHEEDINDLLCRVNYLVSQGRIKDIRMTVSGMNAHLGKHFFFFPGVYDNPPKLVDS